MAGFRKAKAEQAALKIGLFGPAGSGKTFTALLLAEGLAKISKKRIAYVDTERGTDFYCQAVPSRRVHPEAFEFDAIYTRSITDIVQSVKSLKTDEHGVVVLDSMTHIWESCIGAYRGKTTSIGTIPIHAWGQIKKPHNELMKFLLSSPLHVFLCGRQGNEFEEDEEGQLKKVGVKMKAEGETPYEPHILLRMEAIRPKGGGDAIITAFAEKDRTGILSGRSITNPCFDNICKPLLGLLGSTQARVETDDEVNAKDAERMTEDDRRKARDSSELLKEWSAKIDLAKTPEQLKEVGKAITAELKKRMLQVDVAALRDKYTEREEHLKCVAA